MKYAQVMRSSEWCWLDLDLTRTARAYNDDFELIGWLYYGCVVVLLLNSEAAK